MTQHDYRTLAASLKKWLQMSMNDAVDAAYYSRMFADKVAAHHFLRVNGHTGVWE